MSPAFAAGDGFLLLEWEAGQNGNTNWVSFPESAEYFRGLAKIVLEAIAPHSVPESWGDDADEALSLLSI